MENNNIVEIPSFLSSLLSKKALKIGALAAGGAALLLGSILYYQFESEKAYEEELIRDIYTLDQITAFLEDELYNSYPILLEVVQWVPLFQTELSKRLGDKQISKEQLIQFMIKTITSPGNF